MTERLAHGRAAFARQAWREAYSHLAAADREAPLDPDDLEALAVAAYLVGRDAESQDCLTRAHHAFAGQHDVPRAARAAFWLGFGLLNAGEHARGSGWLARAQRMIDDARLDCPEAGYMIIPGAIERVMRGDYEAAREMFERAHAIGERFRDTDLVILAREGRGRVLIRLGRIDEGLALLDEVMVAVTANEASPVVIGNVYCSVIEGCHEIFDLRRAQEWTNALTAWFASHPDAVPFRGHCLVRRSEILQLHGAWPDALEEAHRAQEWLSRPPPQRAVGAALYQQAEVHRLRGEFVEAEDAYRRAGEWGRSAYPGFAELRLAQGQVEPARAALERVLDETRATRNRAPVLVAYVDVLLAAREPAAALAAAEELDAIANSLGAPILRAAARRARGAVLLAENDPRAAATLLREALDVYHDIEAPYESARTRLLLGLACRSLGDMDSGGMELAGARRIFERLGAAPDVARVDALLADREPSSATRLTAREHQVLRLVATGCTNRAIAEALGIREKTVARHISNIFIKLDLSSRSAATAYAYEHQLV